jgi:hypothetical protein
MLYSLARLYAPQARFVAGRPHGRWLYGYKRVYDPESGKLQGQVPDPAEAAIVQEVARRHLAGESTVSIVADLNARGVLLPTGAQWTPTSIKRMRGSLGNRRATPG